MSNLGKSFKCLGTSRNLTYLFTQKRNLIIEDNSLFPNNNDSGGESVKIKYFFLKTKNLIIN